MTIVRSLPSRTPLWVWPLAALAAVLIVAGTASAFQITQVNTGDADADGILDHFQVVTDTSVDDSTLGDGEWTIIGPSITLDSVNTTLTSGGENDNVFYLKFSENLGVYSGDTPSVQYRGLDVNLLEGRAQPSHIQDTDGNNLQDHGPTAATDKVGPAILSLHTNPGQDTVRMTLSEPASSTLTAARVAYGNGASGGATGIGLVTGSGTSYTLTLSGEVTFADIGGDGVRLVSVQDAAGNTAPTGFVLLSDVDAPLIESALSQDLDGDGQLDGILVRFNEPIDDPGSFIAAHWNYTYPSLAKAHPQSLASGTADDEVVFLLFSEKDAAGDTELLPVIEYIAGKPPQRLMDLSGNVLGNHTDQAVPSAGPAVTAADGAAPVVMNAVTADADGDGRIERILLTYSEPLDSGTFDPADWTVAGYPLNGLSPAGTNPDGTPKLASGASGDTITLGVTENSFPDTDARPSVSYTPGGLTDAAADPIDAAALNMVPKDQAAPVLLSFETSSDDSALARFSEPVDNGAGQGLSPAHFDDSAAGSNAGALDDVDHAAGGEVAKLIFADPWTQTDIGGGANIAVVADAVFDRSDAQNPVATTSIPLAQGAPTIVGLTALDRDGDSKVDAVRVELDEKIDDPLHFPPGHWELTPGADGYAYGTILDGKHRPTSVTTGGSADDAFLILHFAERSDVDVDTAGAPMIQYTGAGTSDELVGLDGVPVEGMASAQAATDGVAPLLLEALTRDLDKDGFLDRYVLTFSESINDATHFSADAWRVGGQAILARDVTSAVYDADDAGTGNARLVISFAEGSTPDTGATPQVTYTTAGAFGDAAGNALAPLGTGAVAEADGAAPVMYRFVSEVGRDQATLVFSEGVTGLGSGGSLDIPLDLTYSDALPQGGARTVASITHTAGDAEATVTFSKAFEGVNDFGADSVSPKSSIEDLQGHVHPLDRTLTLTLESSLDETAPGEIADLAVASSTSTTVRLTWTAPGDDGDGGGKVSAYVVKVNTTQFTAGAFDIQDGATFTLDPASIASPGGAQAATVTGLQPGVEYFFRVVAADEADNRGAPSNLVSETTSPPDETAPDAVVDLVVVDGSVTANSVQLSWTAPGDDGSSGDTVNLYVIRHGSATFTGAEFNGQVLAEQVSYTPDLAAPGETQTALVTGLQPGTEYFFGLVSQDEVPNVSGLSNLVSFTTGVDDTPPTGTLAVTSATHLENTASPDTDPAFSWSGLTDDESTITYYYVLNQEVAYTIDGTEQSTTDTSASFSNIPAGSWYFHVAGESAGGFSDQVTYAILIEGEAVSITDAEIESANKAITVTVERDGEANTITWELPSDLPGTPAGVQIWRSNSPYVLLETITSGFQSGTYTDSSSAATEDSRYLVTTFYEGDTGRFAASSAPDTADYPGTSVAPAEGSDEGFAWWMWALVALAVVLIVILLVALVTRTGRSEEEEEDTWSEDEGWSEEPEDEGDETHHMRCPHCDTQFTASGQRPIMTSCPGCGRKGVLR